MSLSPTLPADALTLDAAARHLVRECGSVAAGEHVLIVCDRTTRAVADLLYREAKLAGGLAELREIPPLSRHGEEPGPDVAAAMAAASLVLGVTGFSMAHTDARRQAARAGARYLSLPDYSFELMRDPAVMVDYRARRALVDRFAAAFTRGRRVRVRTAAGTDLALEIDGRTGNACPGFVSRPGDLGSPPDIEANVSPVETRSEGVIVVDGSIPCPEIGLLGAPVTLDVRGGSITQFHGPAATVDALRAMFARVNSPKAYVLAECGVGLNDKARLTGIMLTDEGTLGTVHLGFGSNATVGGENDVSFHLDFVVRDASLDVDGEPLLVDGKVTDR